MGTAAEKGFEQQPRFDGAATAQLDDGYLVGEPGRNVPGMVAQDLRFGSRQVIFGQFTDGLEEGRTFRVVEITAVQSLGRGGQSSRHIAGKLGQCIAGADHDSHEITAENTESAEKNQNNAKKCNPIDLKTS